MKYLVPVSFVLLVGVGCVHKPTLRVVQLASPGRIADDPAVTGDAHSVPAPRDASLVNPVQEVSPAVKKASWLPRAEFALPAGASRDFHLASMTEPFLVEAAANWTGTSDGLAITI